MTDDEKIERKKRQKTEAQMLLKSPLLMEFLDQTDKMCFAAMKGITPETEKDLLHYAHLAKANGMLRRRLENCANQKFEENKQVFEPLGNIHQ